MATTANFSQVPQLITITNIDPGVIDKENTKVNGSELDVVYTTEPADQKVQLYRVNFWINIKPEDSVKLVAQTSEEVAYYMGLNSDKIQVVLTPSN